MTLPLLRVALPEWAHLNLGAEAAAKYPGRKKGALSREKIDVDGNYPVASDPY
ncbi:hypothetical protein ACWAT4_08825 [Bradyrhizobium manausense]